MNNDRKIKIIEYGALTPTYGGIESFIINLISSIDHSRFGFDFIAPNEPNKLAYEDELNKQNFKVIRCYRRWHKSFLGHNIDLVKFFLKNKREYDVAIGNYLDLQNINFLIIAKIFGLKTIAHSHQANENRSWIKKILVLINRFLAKFFVDRFFACSQDAGRWMFGDLWKNSGKCHVVRNGIILNKYIYNKLSRKEVREVLNLNGNFVLGHTGRLSKQKNQKFIIDVFYEFQKLLPNSFLILVGEGPDEFEIKKQIKKLNLHDKVLMLGQRKDIHKIIQGMDVFLFPSEWEGLGISLIEAQAAGLRCFISERIPKEAIVSDLVTVIPLSKKTDFWANKIFDSRKYERINQYDNLAKSGYDILNTAKIIENILYKLVYNEIFLFTSRK